LEAVGAAKSAEAKSALDSLAGEAKPKKKKDKEEVDPIVAQARARAAQAAECGVVGIHDATEVVQSEVACLRLWADRTHELRLHKDCICRMVEQHISTVILMPKACAESNFKSKDDAPVGEFKELWVALRIPKDDTEVKEKDKNKAKAKEPKWPKYDYFPARANWPVEIGTTVTVEGVYLGWTLTGSSFMPSGCKIDKGGPGLPEPLEMLSAEDVRTATVDGQLPDYVTVSLKQRRSANWKIGNFVLRTSVELFAVHVFMVFLSTEPSNYTTKPTKPWDTSSDHAFAPQALFQTSGVWRGPGMDRIWFMYLGTFLLFLALRLLIVVLWAVLPVHGLCIRMVRHALAALYPLAVSLPFVLYLLYFTAAVVACKQCSLWHCGAYSTDAQHLELNVLAFKAAGGCQLGGVQDLHAFRRFVKVAPTKLVQHDHCSFIGNSILDVLGISLDTSRREGTCEAHVDMQDARDKLIMNHMAEVCGRTIGGVESYEVTPQDRDLLPWSMFASGLPIKNNNTCPQTGEGFENGPYIYYEPRAGPSSDNPPQGAICVCRSAHGSRDCYRRLPGTVDRCAAFDAVPQRYGSLLQFDSVPGLDGRFLNIFLTLAVPIFALFTMKAWDDIPLAGVDKFDMRLQSRMKLDVLDFYMFYYMSALLGKNDHSMPLVKFTVPDMTWSDFELYVWCIAWGSAFVWWSAAVLFRIFDFDPDKTPKMWKTVQDILGLAERSAAALEESRVADPYNTAVRKQAVLYEKELQKVIKKRMVVDILDEGVDPDTARVKNWRRCIIVYSTPKVKDLTPVDFEKPGGTFTLHIAGAWPWSRRPPENVWKAESWNEYISQEENAKEAKRFAESGELPPGLEKIAVTFDDVLIRIRPGSPYYWFDVRYLGWCYYCGCQPRSEYKKMKEADHRVGVRDRTEGYSEWYYNKYKFDFFERNIEFVGSLRSLVIDLLFLAARLARGFWGGGFVNGLAILLVMKNCVFGLFGFVFILTCGNTKHSCGPCRTSPAELLAKCIERTKIGNAIKLSMLMPLRIFIESASCGFRMSAESRQAYLIQRLHTVMLRRVKAGFDANPKVLDHEIRLLAGQVEEYQDLIEMLETKNIVRMRAKIRAKDIIA